MTGGESGSLKLVCECFLMLMRREKPAATGIHGDRAHPHHRRTIHALCTPCLLEARDLTDPA